MNIPRPDTLAIVIGVPYGCSMDTIGWVVNCIRSVPFAHVLLYPADSYVFHENIWEVDGPQPIFKAMRAKGLIPVLQDKNLIPVSGLPMVHESEGTQNLHDLIRCNYVRRYMRHVPK
jgi:hypothetical protein